MHVLVDSARMNSCGAARSCKVREVALRNYECCETFLVLCETYDEHLNPFPTNTRYNANLHTIFSSNLSYIGSKIHKQTKEDKILDYKIGERNVSRLFEMCKIIELRGDDYRKKTY